MKKIDFFFVFLVIGIIGLVFFALGGNFSTTANENVGLGATAFSIFGIVLFTFSLSTVINIGMFLIIFSAVGMVLFAIIQFILQVKCKLKEEYEKEAKDDTSFKCHI